MHRSWRPLSRCRHDIRSLSHGAGKGWGEGVGSERTSSWRQDAADAADTPSSDCRAWRDFAYSAGRGFEIGEDKLVARALADVRAYNTRKTRRAARGQAAGMETPRLSPLRFCLLSTARWARQRPCRHASVRLFPTLKKWVRKRDTKAM